jgi:hypothetical protein
MGNGHEESPPDVETQTGTLREQMERRVDHRCPSMIGMGRAGRDCSRCGDRHEVRLGNVGTARNGGSVRMD